MAIGISEQSKWNTDQCNNLLITLEMSCKMAVNLAVGTCTVNGGCSE